jgi:hypothetical protein
MVAQIHRKFLVFYGTRRFVTVFRPPLGPTSNTVYKPANVASGLYDLKTAQY